MNGNKLFIDSNIFLYTLDHDDSVRRNKAKKALLRAAQEYKICISTQVLNEIFAVATRKLKIAPLLVKDYIKGLYQLELIIITKEIIESAIDITILNQIGYWDALMLAAADMATCSTLWSEDLNHEQIYKGIKVINPLTI